MSPHPEPEMSRNELRLEKLVAYMGHYLNELLLGKEASTKLYVDHRTSEGQQ